MPITVLPSDEKATALVRTLPPIRQHLLLTVRSGLCRCGNLPWVLMQALHLHTT